MYPSVALDDLDHETRARLSAGISEGAIYEMVARALAQRTIRGERIVDVGCGTGNLYRYVHERFGEYVGVDIIRYPGLPAEVRFIPLDLDSATLPLPEASADVVVAIETIEHLENPRVFVRQLVKMVKPGGWVVLTTPNQLSLLSLATLLTKRRFNAFQDVHYPAHLTALLEVDLLRIATECGLTQVGVEYSLSGRIVFTARHYPSGLARLFPRALSDNILLIGTRTVASTTMSPNSLAEVSSL